MKYSAVSQTQSATLSDVPSESDIAPFVFIGRSVVLGKGCVVHPFVTIFDNVTIGDNVEIFPGSVIGKPPSSSIALSRNLSEVSGTFIGDGVVINPNVVIYQGVKIEGGCLIGDAASIREEVSIGKESIVGRHVTINYNCKIGNKVKIMDHAWLAGNMTVGDDVFISGGVMTANDNQIGKNGYDETLVKGPDILAGSVIGVGAILLPNITIGEDSLVAAGSVVTSDVGKLESVKGIPAKKYRRSEK